MTDSVSQKKQKSKLEETHISQRDEQRNSQNDFQKREKEDRTQSRENRHNSETQQSID